MNAIGELLKNFKVDKVGIFGNSVKQVSVYSNGIRLERKNGIEEYSFSEIDKITARNYASPTPRLIYISIHIKGNKNKIDLKLHPDLINTNALLEAHSHYLLSENFPDNLNCLDIELGGIGASIRLTNGNILLGKKKIPISEVERFKRNQNGFYDLKLSSVKQNLGISPEESENIVATIQVLNEILIKNQN